MYNFDLNDPQFLPHVGCNVQFSLTQGSALVIVGENGIGKTTLLKHFARKFTVGVLEQKSLDFFYDYSLKQVKSICQEIDLYWGVFGLAEKLDRRLSSLSGGESQAMKIASAFASPQNCLLLDEPSQSLDSDKKKILSQLITEGLRDNKTFLIVEHDLSWLPKNIPVIKLGIENDVIKVVQSWTT